MNSSGHSPALGFNINNPSSQAKSTSKPMSDFAADAYSSAVNDTKQIPASILESPVLKPPQAQPIDLSTFKGFSFATLDSLQIETREIYDDISDTFQWEMCETQEDRCIKFVRDQCVNKRVFLITTGSLGKELVPKIHDLPQIYAIYVYCGDVVLHKKWAANHSKIRVVCNDDDRHLLPRFAVDMAQCYIDLGDALLKEKKSNEAKEKYQKALEKLNIVATKLPKKDKDVDPAMITLIENKIKECK